MAGSLAALGRFALSKRPQQWCPHTPHPLQEQFLKLDGLEALYGGAAGGGKSDALLMAALQHVHVPAYSAILFRRTYTDLALPGAIMDRSHEWLTDSPARWDDRQKTWHFPSGATLAFGYLDGPRDHLRYQGAEFQFIGFDEVTQFEELPYLYLFSRLRRLKGSRVPLRMRAATNPGGIGHNWVKRRFIDDPEDRVFIPAKLDDNPHLDAEQYEQALSRLDPVTRQQLRDGLWVQDTSGLVYRLDPDKNITQVVPALPPGETWTKVLAMDFGVTDPTAFCVLAFTRHDPVVYGLESEEWTDLAPSEAAELVEEWWARHGGFAKVIGDEGGLGKGFGAEMRKRFAIPVHPAEKRDKLGYIKLFNGDLTGGKLQFVAATNEKLIRDMSALAWADEKHQKEHPGLPNHLPDAALYGWRECRHWAWDARERVPAYGTPEWYEAEAEKRRETKRQRIRREQEELEQW